MRNKKKWDYEISVKQKTLNKQIVGFKFCAKLR